jgi:DNA-directed RNA polymerase subunit RPC12/RpoP
MRGYVCEKKIQFPRNPSPVFGQYTVWDMKTYFKFACIICGQHLECETALSGRQIRCPACHSRIVIPNDAMRHSLNRPPLMQFAWDAVVEVPEVSFGSMRTAA